MRRQEGVRGIANRESGRTELPQSEEQEGTRTALVTANVRAPVLEQGAKLKCCREQVAVPLRERRDRVVFQTRKALQGVQFAKAEAEGTTRKRPASSANTKMK